MGIPILTVYDSGGNEIPIPAIKGEPGAPGTDGQDGQTPVRGTDYWTEDDKAEIVADVLEEIYQGADLGLQIACQLDQPASPADNMIWVETETAMPAGKYIASSQQPTAGLVNGFLWLREMYMPLAEITLPGSHVSLSIAQVWQYENGAWVWKSAHVYSSADEEWKDTGVYWFKEGVGFNNAVFGATYKSTNSLILIDQNNSCIEFVHQTSGSVYKTLSAQTLLPANKYHYLVIDAEVTYGGSSSPLMVGIDNDYSAETAPDIGQNFVMQSRGITVIDISSADAPFVPKCRGNEIVGAKIYNLWLV